MATMNVHLPDPMKTWVETLAKGGRYGNASDYVRGLIRQDQERQQAITEIQILVDEGLSGGPTEPFEPDAFLRSKRAACARNGN